MGLEALRSVFTQQNMPLMHPSTNAIAVREERIIAAA